MKELRFIFRVCGVIALFLASCAKEGPTGPTGNAGPSLTGSISGHIKLFDKYGSPVLTKLNTTKIYFNGSVNYINPDTNGYFLFSSLVTGNYSIVATDSAFAGTARNNIQLVTGALNQDIRLSAIPDSFVASFHAYHIAGSAYDSLVITLSPDSRNRNCILFANNSLAIGSTPGRYLWVQAVAVAPNVSTIIQLVPAQDLYDAGLTSGATVYFAAYSYVVGDASVYEDLGTGKNVYNAVNTNALIDSAYVP